VPDNVPNLNPESEIIPTGSATDSGRKRIRQTSVHESYEFTWVGPLPPPDVLIRYNEAFPGCAERIVAQAEKQSEHRQHLEHITVEGNVRSEVRGSWQAFLIAFFVLALGGFLIWRGQNVLGTIFVGADIASLAGIFLTGKASQRRQLAESSKAIESAMQRGRQEAETSPDPK
jgi:uncharacterized membrane protein